MTSEVRCKRCAERGYVDTLARLEVAGDQSRIERPVRYSRRETERQILAQGVENVGSYNRTGWEPINVRPTDRIPFVCHGPGHHRTRTTLKALVVRAEKLPPEQPLLI